MAECGRCWGCTCNGSCICKREEEKKIVTIYAPEEYKGLTKREAINKFLEDNNKQYITSAEMRMLWF